MKEKLKRLAATFCRAAMPIFKREELSLALLAILSVTVAEILNVGFVGGIAYFFRRPLSFACAALIIYFTFTITFFIRRRVGVILLIECFWLGIAVTNKILLSYRVNPLSAVDFSIISSVFSIINVYLSPLQIVFIIVALVLALALVVFAVIRLPKRVVRWRMAGVYVLFSAAVAVVSVFASTLLHAKDFDKMNLPEVYKEYGFVYSFTLTCVDRGIDRPDEYSRVNISELISDESDTSDTTNGDEEPSATGKPNVIFVQLESFFDPEQIRGLVTSEDAIDNFRALKDNYPSGSLTVPVAGAGTVNTEFEVLCGIPISVFGLGEYPYETVLSTTPCESLAYYLASSGYTTHAVHNHTGTFYDRYIVMQNLGFDTFTPVEYMSDVHRNLLGWAEDSHLTDEITGILGSTESEDFIYAVSVQAHGKYVNIAGDYGDIAVSGNFDEQLLFAMEYYVNQLSETDEFVGELVSELEKLNEDTVVVFFGDHQPSLELTSNDVKCKSLYTTEYVIWSNFALEAEDEDIYAYSLGSHVLSLLGEKGGIISQMHAAKTEDSNRTQNLKDLAYDLLFGEKYAYGGEFPYTVPEIQYGWRKISAESAYIKGNALYVLGEGFTESSVILVDGKKRDTVYVGDSLVIAPGVSAGELVTVAQTAENGVVFGEVICKISKGDNPSFDVTWDE